MSMVREVLAEFEHQTEEITVIPSRGGVFEVVVDGELIYSKKATGRHATYDDVAVPLREHLGR